MRILFCGGGTGGHIFPALAIREIIIRNSCETIETAYAGRQDGMEFQIVQRIPDCPFLPVRAQGMPREITLKWLSFPFFNFLGLIDAINHLRSFKPDFVVATGGFVTFPVLFASWLMRIPFVVHEQNAIMGITNRFFRKYAKLVMLSFSPPNERLESNVVVVGNPIREEFLKPSNKPSRFNPKAGEFWILAVGGSRGAKSINMTIVELVKNWLIHQDSVVIIHITGERDYSEIKGLLPETPRLILLPFLHEMKQAFDVASLVISRAGATTLAELAYCGKPAILVPYPYATDNHQEKNARLLEEVGAARVIADNKLNWETLAKTIEEIRSPTILAGMGEKMKASRPSNVEDKIFSFLKMHFPNL